MHQSGNDLVAHAVGSILQRKISGLPPSPKVLDVGSYDVNGTLRPIFDARGFRYVGCDIEAGPNVDHVANAYDLKIFPDDSFDVVVSSQVFEHLEMPLLAAMAMKRVCRPGGWVVICSPSEWPEHKHPVDCWRLLPDGMRFLLEGFQNVQALLKTPDCVGWGQKPEGYRERWQIQDLKAQ